MLEYFSHKKIKKHQAEKRALSGPPSPVLSEEDEHFLGRIVSAEGTPPPLPDRPHFLNPEVINATGNDAQLVVHQDKEDEKGLGKGKGKENAKDQVKVKKKVNRFSFLRRGSKKSGGLEPNSSVPPTEAEREEADISRVLDELNLAAVNNRAFSLSKESQDLVRKFTVILKDLVNGVPTAYDDLVNLIEDSQGTLAKSYDHLPPFLQKLITTLPNKLTSTLAPELLAAATEAQGFAAAGASGGVAGLGAAAKKFLTPTSLKDLVTKPGAVVGMLKAIMNALKLRFPAFLGTNVLLSLGLFVLLFVFWYCHKRGKEVRLEKERIAASNGRVVELQDDPMITGQPTALPAANSGLRPVEALQSRSNSQPLSRGSSSEKVRKQEKSDRRK